MRILLLVVLLLRCSVGYTQLPNISFEHITDRDGLPSRAVECAVEDSSGFMWFGTRKCLARYDGYTFRQVGNRWIHGVAADKAGSIYYSTNREKLGSVKANLQKARPLVGFAEGGASNTFIDSFGNVWFSDRETINRYDPVANRNYRYPMKKTTWVFNKGSFVEDRQRNV